MVKSGLFPKDIVEQKNLELLDPYEIRFKALTEQVPLHHLGRALFHINQRRGFKSSRKDKSEETTSGVVSKSVRALYEEMQLINPAPVIDDPKALREYALIAHECNIPKSPAETCKSRIKSVSSKYVQPNKVIAKRLSPKCCRS